MLDYDSGDNVSIRVNERFYFIFVLSGYHFFVRDNETPVYCLEKDTTEEKLGEMLKLALSQCRIIIRMKILIFLIERGLMKTIKSGLVMC
ncbi:contact-dependent growth inhibition system immunity protein [Providencia hangzhouensis]|uniref:contact-dependent growth inhibition system immunity protein n=1 Tax=Providencia hangzhouensis TaxID=3031799 RepID=UPI0034DCF6F0